MNLLVNGENKTLGANQSTLSTVIKELGHHPRLVVVELNGVIVPPQNWEDKEIKDGDILEIVTIFGGGS